MLDTAIMLSRHHAALRHVSALQAHRAIHLWRYLMSEAAQAGSLEWQGFAYHNATTAQAALVEWVRVCKDEQTVAAAGVTFKIKAERDAMQSWWRWLAEVQMEARIMQTAHAKWAERQCQSRVGQWRRLTITQRAVEAAEQHAEKTWLHVLLLSGLRRWRLEVNHPIS